MPYLLLVIWVSIKSYSVFAFVSFGLKCVLILKDGSVNAITVYLHTVGDDLVKNWFFLDRLVLPLLFLCGFMNARSSY